MTRSPWLAGLYSALLPTVLWAQVTTPSPLSLVEDWDERYEAAYRDYQARFSQYMVLNSDWDRLNEEYNRIRETDERGSERLLAEIQQRHAERGRAISAVRAAERVWYDAGDAFVAALDNYLEILNESIQRAAMGDSMEGLIEQFDRWDLRLREVELQLGPRIPLEIAPMPEIRARDDDTGDDLRLKASLLEDRAQSDAELLEDIDQAIADLERRLERDRSRAAFRARIERFGSEVPIGADPARVGGADSTEVDLTQTPQQRIELFREFRDQVELWREQLLEIARELLEEADRRGV